MNGQQGKLQGIKFLMSQRSADGDRIACSERQESFENYRVGIIKISHCFYSVKSKLASEGHFLADGLKCLLGLGR